MADYGIYAQRHGLAALFQDLLADVIVNRPSDPIEHMISFLKKSPVLRVIVYGPPASGKHTLATMLIKRCNAVSISIEDAIRDAQTDGEEIATQAAKYLDEGNPVPQDLAVALIIRRTKKADCLRRGYVLYDCPRTRPEALALQAGGVLPTHFLVLEAPTAVLLERFKGRRVDPLTKDVYHMTFAPPPSSIAARVVPLARDTDTIMDKAMIAYNRNSQGVIACFEGIRRNVNVDQPQDDAADAAWTWLCTQGESNTPFTPRILLLGPPGSGRATQGNQLAKKYNVVYVNAGTLVRQAVATGSEVGQVCSVYLKRKALLPDTLMVKILRERLSKSDCVQRGWVLRGFPRTREQAIMFQRSGVESNRVVIMQLPEDIAMERLCTRRTDSVTGKSYTTMTAPPDIASRLVQHPKDHEDAVHARYGAWMEHAEDISDAYPTAQKISAQGDLNRVFELVEGTVVHPRKKEPVV